LGQYEKTKQFQDLPQDIGTEYIQDANSQNATKFWTYPLRTARQSEAQKPVVSQTSLLNESTRQASCPRPKDRNTKYRCHKSDKYLCLENAVPYC
jgi:hypothetical protein